MFYDYNYYDVLDCSNVSTTIDPFWDISLDLGPTEAETGTFLFLVFSLLYLNSTNLFVSICGAGVTFIYIFHSSYVFLTYTQLHYIFVYNFLIVFIFV